MLGVILGVPDADPIPPPDSVVAWFIIGPFLDADPFAAATAATAADRIAAAAAAARPSACPSEVTLARSPLPPLTTVDNDGVDGEEEEDIGEKLFDEADTNDDAEGFLSCCCLVSSDNICAVEVLTTSDGRPAPRGKVAVNGVARPEVDVDTVLCAWSSRDLAAAVAAAATDEGDDAEDTEVVDCC